MVANHYYLCTYIGEATGHVHLTEKHASALFSTGSLAPVLFVLDSNTDPPTLPYPEWPNTGLVWPWQSKYHLFIPLKSTPRTIV